MFVYSFYFSILFSNAQLIQEPSVWLHFSLLVISHFKKSGSFYFCNQCSVGVCALTYACLTAVENICLERTPWSTADIWLLHNKGWGWTPNKQHTHTIPHTHTHSEEAHRWRCKRRTKQDNKDFKVILWPHTWSIELLLRILENVNDMTPVSDMQLGRLSIRIMV